MRNLIKKSLAFVLVAALALTCFVGTFSVSAADTYNANISVTANPVTLGDTEATAVIDIDMVEENVGINEALINISSEIGAIKDVKLTASDVAGEIDYGTGEDVVPADCKGFYLSANSEKVDGESVMGSIASATITVTFAVADTVKAGTYAITIDIPTSKVIAATKDEVAVNFIYDNSVSFVVEEAAPETYTVTFVDADGTVLKTEDVAPNAAATAPEVADDVANDTYFSGWDVDFSNITSDTTVTAKYVNLAFRIRTRYLKLQDAIRYCVTIQTDKGSFTDEAVEEFGILVWDEGETEFLFDTATVVTRNEDTYYDASTDRYELCIDKTSKQMSDAFVARVYAKLKNGTIVYGKKDGEYQYHNASIKDYSESQINNAKTAENMKKLITALLIYGSKAQIAFEYNTNNLADSGLTEAQKSAIEAETAPWNAISERLDDTNTTLDATNSTTRIRTASLMLQSNTMINYGVDLSGDAKASQISEVYILSWSEDDYNAIVAENINGLVYGTETGCELAELNPSNNRYYANSYPLKSKDLYDDVYTRAYIVYNDGTVGYTGILKYSAEYYCQNYAKPTSTHSAALKALYNAVMVYGNYAIINFG